MRALLAAALLATAACASAPPPPAILVVRHADRDPGRDPDLNDAGRARAEALVEPARRAGVVAVFHTQFKRTKQTAAPVALALRIPMFQVDIAANQETEYAEAVARNIAASCPGKPVLIVSHSNAIPALLKKLGVESPREIPETEYGVVFVVTSGKVSEQKF
jgi:probable phosphoglycerate mutase